MIQIGIAQLNKNPAIIDTLEEIEYQKFLTKNHSLIDASESDDETLLDGLDTPY
jgi:hypothetical protein